MVHEWRHWKAGGSLSLKYETEKIKEKIAGEKVNFIAKSVGTRVLMKMVFDIENQINKVVLCGIPIDPVGYVKSLKLLGAERIIVFQNSKDPFLPYKSIKTYLGLIDKKIKVIEGQRNDHHYPYFEEFKSFLSS